MATNGRERDSASSHMGLSAAPEGRTGHHESSNAAAVRPSEPQRRYLERGLEEPGGKLPLFDRAGREVPKKTIEACIAHGWAEPWIRNPIKPDWMVCRLTADGFRALGRTPPGGTGR
jgi:hypothetical protein